MTTRQTAWPGFPPSLHYGVPVPRPSYWTGDYAGVPVGMPRLHRTAMEMPIQNNTGGTSPAQQAMTSHKRRSRMSGAKTCRCEMPRAPQEMLPSNERETVTLLGCSSSWDRSQKHPHEKICHSKLHLQDSFQTTFYSPITQDPKHKVKQCILNEVRPSWHVNSSTAVCMDRAALMSFSVDMEQERRREWAKPELRSQTAMTQNQTADFKYAEVSPLQSTTEKVSSSVDTVADEASLSFEDQSDNFHSIMEDDKSILVCLESKDVKAHNSGVHSGPVTTNSEVASSENLKSDQSVIKKNTAEKYTSPIPCVMTCDIMAGTELALCMTAFTQTEDPKTSDMNVITEVHMADLDYIAEEFNKLKAAEGELREQKENMNRPKNLPADILNVLQKLESDYTQMRDEILAGVPLEQLEPLSVDSEKTTTGASYIPAQIIGDVLGSVPSWSSQEQHYVLGESNESQSRNTCQSQRKEQTRRAGGDVPFVTQDGDAIHNANKQEEKQTPAVKELNRSEVWYDAEEDLESAGPAVAAEMGQDPTVITEDKNNESASEEAKSSLLCVSNLPCNVTESDLTLWFEKYHASEVSISALKNDLRVAIVVTSGRQSAEAAVRELNGCSMQGHTLHVQHVSGTIGGSHSQAFTSISGRESSQGATKPQTSKTEPSGAERKSVLCSSIKTRKVVSTSPTAKGTYVPQHFGTMGSFDTLMAELMQRHPDVVRQRIVDALIELNTKHQGVLCSLPLSTIREMTSELLTRRASATQL